MSLLGYLVAIAAIDSFNPTATAIQVYLLTTPKPVGRAIAFITSIFLAYWTVGCWRHWGLPDSFNGYLKLTVNGCMRFNAFWELHFFIQVLS